MDGRTEEDGTVIEAGLEDVVAADVGGEATGYDGKLTEGVEDGEQAHGIDEDDAGGARVAPEAVGNFFGVEEVDDFIVAVGVTRGEVDGAGDELEDVEEFRFFGGVGTGDENGVRGEAGGEVWVYRKRFGIEFEIAPNLRSCKREEALEMFFILNEDKIEVGEEFFREGVDEVESASGTGREFAADESGFSAKDLGFLEEIVPDVAFDEEEGFRLEGLDPTTHDEAKIEGHEAVGIGWDGTLGLFLTGSSTCGDENEGIGIILPDFFNETFGGLYFTNGDSVDPNDVGRIGNIKTEALPEGWNLSFPKDFREIEKKGQS